MTTPTTDTQMPPLPVVAWLTEAGILESNFVYKSCWTSKPADEPLCKVSDAQAYAAQRCQGLEQLSTTPPTVDGDADYQKKKDKLHRLGRIVGT